MRYEVTLIATIEVEADNDDAALRKAEDCVSWVECVDQNGQSPEVCKAWTVDELHRSQKQAEKLLEDLTNYNKENNKWH